MIANDGVAFWDLPKSILSIRQQTKVFLKIIRHSNKKGGKIQTHKLPMGSTKKSVVQVIIRICASKIFLSNEITVS